MNKLKQLFARLQAYKHYDKVLHVVAGGVVAAVYFAMVLAIAMYAIVQQSTAAYLYLMYTPHFLVGLVVAAFVHASKEVNDYLGKLRGENHEVSFWDFAAGMTGSFITLYLLF